jgi:hypothetical protein
MEGSERERKAHVCCDCKARSPETDTNYTLISSRYGWRLTRHVASDGTFTVEWRCPRCWERYKLRKTGGGETAAAGRTDSAPPPSAEVPKADVPKTPPASSARARRLSSTPPRAASSSPPRRKK